MPRVYLLLMAGALSAACDRAPSGPASLPSHFSASLTPASACHGVSGTLAVRFVGSDGTQFFFEGEVHGDLEGTLAQAIVIDPPTASLPNVVHVSGTGEWTINTSSVSALSGRVLVFSLQGIAVAFSQDDLGHAFHATLVGGARSGNIVSQEPESDFLPYHGEICP